MGRKKIGILEISKSYKLTEFFVREHNMIKSLTLSKQGSAIEEVADIGPVHENSEILDQQTGNTYFNVAVKQLESFNACVRGKGRVEPLTPPGGHCSRRGCGMFQRIDWCIVQVAAHLITEYEEASQKKIPFSISIWANIGKSCWTIQPTEVTAHKLDHYPTHIPLHPV